MAIAALVVSIVSILIATIPFCGMIAFVPAMVAIVLGIVDLVNIKKNRRINPLRAGKIFDITAIILGGISILAILFWILLYGIVGFGNRHVYHKRYQEPYPYLEQNGGYYLDEESGYNI